ncbi:MAG TPA: outer membrane beta-barrel protein [Verrucomicrobiota bacterium]|jgi:hypothetical protein|nr:outer membrane beta-barrel protein [Verrucomicrobiota bacterium]HQL79427.1 outer membrane beta-barrel protein [Verrucomicrobiota bacterium]
MKYNKWTVALAALGVVSLASAAKADEGLSSVQTALASTTLSGYVDTSAQWNFGSGNNYLPPYRFGGTDKADGFNLNVIQLRIEKPLDEQDWAAGYRADLWFGPDANVLGTSSYGWGNDSDFNIRQAYVALRAPVGTGLDFKMGVFDSIIGYESIESGNNPNFTRSYGHSIEPVSHTGLLASYRFCECFSASAGVANTWGNTINERAFNPLWSNDARAESYKSYMGSIAFTAPDSWGFLSGSTLYGGIVNGFGSSGNYGETVTSYYVGATVATPVTGLRAGVSFDQINIHHVDNDNWSLAGYLSYQATEKLSLHARAEYYMDTVDGGGTLLYWTPVGKAEVLALTATVQYDLWKNVISRLEFRWDHSLNGNHLFGGDTDDGNGGAHLKNAWMLAANVIYKF